MCKKNEQTVGKIALQIFPILLVFDMILAACGPWGHWAKIMADKYQMWQLQSGRY